MKRRFCSYSVQWINSKAAVLMIWIAMAVYIYWTLLPDGDISSGIKQAPHKYSRADVYLISTLSIFYPLFGWIADAWIEQYRVILYGFYSLIIGCILLTVSVIIIDLDLMAHKSSLDKQSLQFIWYICNKC